MQDGIYFDLPEAEYHALPRLGSSGIKDLLVSLATFWARSWMNPDRQNDDTVPRIIGRAYHAARFRPDDFHDEFTRDLVKEDLPDALMTDAEIKAALKDMGEAQTKAGEGVQDRARRLCAAGYEGEIWHLEREKFEEGLDDREPLPPQVWAEIERDSARLHHHPDIGPLLRGGEGEVTALWTCEETGVGMKARFDYLTATHFADLKTFDNSRGVRLERAIRNAFQWNGYYVQAALYWQAAELIRSGALDVIGDASENQRNLLSDIRRNPDLMRAWYIFQEKNGVPNILAREYSVYTMHPSMEAAAPDEDAAASARRKYSRVSRLHEKADAEISWAKRQYLAGVELYGDTGAPWYPTAALHRWTDEDFNSNWLDSD